ncbi:MAG: NADPH-dependent oxidoreductase [Clostridiaceae bacterium]
MNQVIETMKNHRSIRNYLDREVSEDIINELIDVAQAAPSSINGQQTSVIVIRDKQRKEKIAELAGGQHWIANAPVFLLFVADFYKVKLASEKTNKPLIITDSIESIMVASVDAGLSMQNVITAAESLELGIVPIGGIRKSPDEIIELLQLPEYTYPIVGLALGYPADNSKKKPRMPREAYRHDEVYNKEKLKDIIDKYDEDLSVYLKDIDRTQEVNWSNQTMNVYQYVYFPKVYPSLKTQGFKNEK